MPSVVRNQQLCDRHLQSHPSFTYTISCLCEVITITLLLIDRPLRTYPALRMGTANKAGAAQEYPQHPFTLPTEEVSQHLNTDILSGLSRAKAQEYKSKYGENKLSDQGGVKWYAVLLKQASNAMILVSCPF